MLEQEGAKPQLTIVGTAAAEGIPISEPETAISYTQKLSDIITTLTKEKLAGKQPDAYGALTHLDAHADNSALRDWLADNGVMTKAVFDRTLQRIERDRRITDELGFVPIDAVDLVRRYAEHANVSLSARGTITRQRSYKVGDTDIIDARNCDTSRETRMIFDVANSQGDNLDSFGRELRLIVDRLNLQYRDSVISDALQTWQEETTRRIKVDAMLDVHFTKGKATGSIGADMWAAMEAACFDATERGPGFATAIIKKFIWQVKRKTRNLPVTNHLMPVLTGPQGKGKTEFVKAMTLPLRDLMREVDFNLITDGKTADIWASAILFIDEMGFFSKADVDQVKNLITTDNVAIRTMRQNHSAAIRNAATFIGCSNKSLSQLIRDETGVRRFAELEWRHDPDWEASNALDWRLLWQSVDENGPDPVAEANMFEKLREQQEANRNQSPVEIWVLERGQVHLREWRSASEIHVAYRDWEKEAFPRRDTSQSSFGKELTGLAGVPTTPLEKKRATKGICYRWKGGSDA